MYGIDHAQFDLDRELARAGITREQVTDVVLTHLHFDHAGGTHARWRRRAGAVLPQRDLPPAAPPLEVGAPARRRRTRGSFRRRRLRTRWSSSGRLHLLEGATELYDGIHLFVSEGHTVGLQLVRVEREDKTLVFCGDLVPTTSHLSAPWVAAYDLYPLTAIEEKKQLLAQAVEERLGALPRARPERRRLHGDGRARRATWWSTR